MGRALKKMRERHEEAQKHLKQSTNEMWNSYKYKSPEMYRLLMLIKNGDDKALTSGTLEELRGKSERLDNFVNSYNGTAMMRYDSSFSYNVISAREKLNTAMSKASRREEASRCSFPDIAKLIKTGNIDELKKVLPKMSKILIPGAYLGSKLKHLAEALKGGNNTIEEIDLSDNNLYDSTASIVEDMVGNCRKLCKLVLRGNNFKSAGIYAISSLVPSLKSVDFGESPLTKKQEDYLAKLAHSSGSKVEVVKYRTATTDCGLFSHLQIGHNVNTAARERVEKRLLELEQEQKELLDSLGSMNI